MFFFDKIQFASDLLFFFFRRERAAAWRDLNTCRRDVHREDTRKIAEIVAARDENGMRQKFKLARRRQEFKSGHINQLVRGSSKTRGLQAAEMVNLYNNGLSCTIIHAFASAENLLHLNLGCNALKEIPPEITQLRALRGLAR